MPRPDVSEERKAQILQAALELFSQVGYEAASMNDLASKCDLSKAAIYHYFDSKDAILIALTEQVFQADTDALLALEQSPLPAEDRLRAYLQTLVEEITKLKPLHGMFMEFYSQAARTPVIRGHLQRYYDQYERTLMAIFQQGIDRGEFRPHDVQQTTQALMVGIEGAIVVSVIREADLQSLVNAMLGIILQSVR
ncbi:MAG: TetR/AcrR family transcriptional regulator [Anaerolineaceae bacterium]|nr:TetR/AcrR family transcriptional regulator [Anaerolineaceae bacterium]